MTTKYSKLIATGAIITTVGLVATASFADSKPLELQPPQSQKMMKLQKPGHGHCMRVHKKGHHNGVAGSWRKAMHINKHLTADQAQTLTKAAIILYGNPQMMKVGEVKPIKLKKGGNGYLVTIQSPKGAALKTIKVNAANGRVLPMKRIKQK